MRCLILDDEQHDRDVIARVVTRAGHEARCAGDAAEALALVREGGFDVALVDLGMPGVDGTSALRMLRGESPELRLLVVSGWEDRTHVIAAIAAGADGYVVKTDLESLVPALADVSVGGGPMSRRIAHFVLDEVRAAHAERAPVNAQEVLSKRQWEILQELSRGLTYKAIGESLGISANTVRHHIRLISRKLAVKGGREAVRQVLGNNEGEEIPSASGSPTSAIHS